MSKKPHFMCPTINFTTGRKHTSYKTNLWFVNISLTLCTNLGISVTLGTNNVVVCFDTVIIMITYRWCQRYLFNGLHKRLLECWRMCVCRTEGERYTWFGRYLHWTIGRKKGKIEILFTGSSYDIAWGEVSGASEIKYTIVDPTSLRQRKYDKRIFKLLDDEEQTDVL